MDTSGTLQRQIAEEARIWMVRRQTNPQQIAKKLGWTPAYLSRRMTGAVEFTTSDLASLAMVLDIAVIDLLPGPDDGVTSTGSERDLSELLVAA